VNAYSPDFTHISVRFCGTIFAWMQNSWRPTYLYSLGCMILLKFIFSLDFVWTCGERSKPLSHQPTWYVTMRKKALKEWACLESKNALKKMHYSFSTFKLHIFIFILFLSDLKKYGCVNLNFIIFLWTPKAIKLC
jgi:hypothetical protein